jgi:hypothetical protein
MGPENPGWIMALASEYGNAAVHPNTLFQDRNNAPTNWGNTSERTEWFFAKGVTEGIIYGPDALVYYYFSDWFIYSVNQATTRWP